MTRDYVKYKKRRQRQTSRSSVWFFGLFFCGLIAGVAVYAHYKPAFSVASLKDLAVLKVASYFPQLHKPKAHSASKKLAANTQETVKPIHFDFYDELPKAQLDFSGDQPLEEDASVVEEPKTTVAALKKPLVLPDKKKKDDSELEQNIAQELATDLSSIKSADTSPYILQLSVFHSLEAANRYRSALASAGLKVDLVRLKIGKVVVYRLQQGPYYNLDQLKLAKKRLAERGIACDIRKATPYV